MQAELSIIHSGRAGADGRDGSRGPSGTSAGSDGADGEHAGPSSPGTDAKAIDLSLRRLSGRVLASWEQGEQQGQLAYGDSSSSIFLEARGGRGGRGGDGGPGGDGARGRRGQDATRYRRGSDGGPGGAGGDGGDASDGSRGGDGADVTLRVDADQTDLAMLVRGRPNCSGGAGGSAGRPGAAGSGGAGGSGGNSYSWTETVDDGDDGSHTVHHSNPGGSRGRRGADGRSGAQARSGEDGSSGRYRIIVGEGDDTHIYTQRFDLSVVDWHVEGPAAHKLFEPGQILQVRCTLRNTSTMPSPSSQAVRVTLANHEGLTVTSEPLVIDRSLEPGESIKIEQALSVRLADYEGPSVGEPYNPTRLVDFRAQQMGVNKPYEHVSAQSSTLQVSYPVEIADFQVEPVISIDEQAPFALKITNVAHASLGLQRHLDATLALRPGLVRGDQLVFTDKAGQQRSLMEAIRTEIGELGPKQSRVISGTLQFSDAKLGIQSRAELATTLSLQRHDAEQMQAIHERRQTVQLAQAYQHNPHAELLLVSSARTSKAQLAAWDKLCRELGMDYAQWNVSLNSGLSLHQARGNRRSLFDDFKDKLIVFVDAVEHPDQTNLPMRELYAAARAGDLATCIFAQAEPLPLQQPVPREQEHALSSKRELFKRLDASLELGRVCSIAVSSLCCVCLSAEKKAESLHRQLRKRILHRDFTVTHDADEQRLRVHLGPSRQQLQLASSAWPFAPENRDCLFAIVKMLSTQRKCELLARLHDKDHYAPVLVEALISDLAMEGHSLRNGRWSKTHQRKEIAAQLLNAKEVADAARNNRMIHDLLRPALLDYYYLVYRSCHWRFHKACQDVLQAVLGDIPRNEWRALKDRYKGKNTLALLEALELPLTAQLRPPERPSKVMSYEDYLKLERGKESIPFREGEFHFKSEAERVAAIEEMEEGLKHIRQRPARSSNPILA